MSVQDSPRSVQISSFPDQTFAKRQRGDPPPRPEKPRPLRPANLARVNAQSILRLVLNTEEEDSLGLSRFRLLGEIPGKSEKNRAFFLQSDDSCRVLKINTKQNGNAAALSRLAAEIFEYKKLKEIHFPIAHYEDLEPYIEKDEFERILQENSDPHEKLKEFTENNLTTGYHLVDYIPGEFPQKRDTIPKEKERDYPIFLHLKELFSILHKHQIPARLERTQLRVYGNKIIYVGLNPVHDDNFDGAAFDVLIPELLESFTSRDSPLWKFLDPRPIAFSN